MAANSKEIVKQDKQFKAFMRTQLKLRNKNYVPEKETRELNPGLIEKIHPKNKSITNDLEIQYKRILHILDKLISRLKISACYHYLFRDDLKLIRDCIRDENELNYVVNVLQNVPKVIRNKSSSSIALSTIDPKQQSEHEFNKAIQEIWQEHFDPAVSRCVDIIYRNKLLMSNIEDLFENSDDEIIMFTNYIKKIKDIIIQKSQMNSTEELARERELKQAYSSNVMLVEHIQELQQQLEKQKEELGAELEKKNALVQKYIESIQKTKEDFRENIKTKIHESEKAMTQKSLRSEETQEQLKMEADSITNEYNRILEEHLSMERMLRARRLKVEAQLASWISKYDQDIGELQAQYEKIKKEYDDDVIEMNSIQEMMDEQEEEYIILMAEKEEEETRICEEMALAYLKRRAAKVIQRAWRAYWIRKLERKKARKSKGKGDKKKGKEKKKREAPKQEVKSGGRTADPNAALEKAFKGEAFDEIKNPNAFG